MYNELTAGNREIRPLLELNAVQEHANWRVHVAGKSYARIGHKAIIARYAGNWIAIRPIACGNDPAQA